MRDPVLHRLNNSTLTGTINDLQKSDTHYSCKLLASQLVIHCKISNESLCHTSDKCIHCLETEIQ